LTLLRNVVVEDKWGSVIRKVKIDEKKGNNKTIIMKNRIEMNKTRHDLIETGEG